MDDAHYWIYVYKVAKCPAKERHDWSACPYAHRGERAARRCPQLFNYSAEPCPEYGKKGTCPQGDACPMAHSVFESWLHPSRFRTQLCCFGASCRRRICFFAHNVAQMRVAPVAASTAGGLPVMRRTQAVVPASAMSPAAESSSAAAACTLPAATAVYPGMLPASSILPGSMASVVPGIPLQSQGGWVLTNQGWTLASMDVAAGAGAAMAAPLMMPQAARAGNTNAAAVAAANVSALASGLEGLVLQPNQLPLSPGQQQLLGQPGVLQAGPAAYLTTAPAGLQVVSSQPASYATMNTAPTADPLEPDIYLQPGVATLNSASGSLVGYSGNSASGAAARSGDQMVQELQFYQQQPQERQNRPGPQGW